MRMGPMRVGFHGTLQPIADALKLVTKGRHPALVGEPARILDSASRRLPSGVHDLGHHPVARDLVLRNLELGLFYITAVTVLSVLGLVMAGWGSANKWAMLGALRAAGQLVSYEVPFIMALLGVAMLDQSLNLITIVDGQANYGYAWYSRWACSFFLQPAWPSLAGRPSTYTTPSLRSSAALSSSTVVPTGRCSFWPSTLHFHRGRADRPAVSWWLEVARDAAGRQRPLDPIGRLVPGEDRPCR